MNVPLPTEADVLAAVQYDEARTTQEVADAVCGALSWPRRGTVRNRLLALEAQGLVISDEERPERWIRPTLSLTPCPWCDEAAVTDEHGCCVHCGKPRRREDDEDARYDAAVEEREREERADEHDGLDD